MSEKYEKEKEEEEEEEEEERRLYEEYLEAYDLPGLAGRQEEVHNPVEELSLAKILSQRPKRAIRRRK